MLVVEGRAINRNPDAVEGLVVVVSLDLADGTTKELRGPLGDPPGSPLAPSEPTLFRVETPFASDDVADVFVFFE